MSSITDKLALANTKVPNVYDAGKSCKDITDFSYFFQNNTRLEMVDCINTCNGTNFDHMFYNCYQLQTLPQLNVSKGINLGSMLDGCESLQTIPTLDCRNAVNTSRMFNGCIGLTTIPKLDVSNSEYLSGMFANCFSLTTISQLVIGEQCDLTNTFSYCNNLTNITIAGTIPASVSFTDSSLLTLASLESIIYALKINTDSTKPTLSLSEDSWTILAAATPPTGYDAWQQYIYEYKAWNYA